MSLRLLCENSMPPRQVQFAMVLAAVNGAPGATRRPGECPQKPRSSCFDAEAETAGAGPHVRRRIQFKHYAANEAASRLYAKVTMRRCGLFT
jgi:hypothetical protein